MQCLKVKSCLTVPVGKRNVLLENLMHSNVSFIIYIEVTVPVISYTYDLFSSYK